MRKRPTVDVIIPAYKPGPEFIRLLDALEGQRYPIEHILIMNTGEEHWNPEWEMGRERLEVFHLKKEEFDHGATRDEAAQMSLADILVFMTQDAIPVNEWLVWNLVNAFKKDRVAAAYARQLPRKNSDPIEEFTRTFNYPPYSQVKSGEDLDRLGIKTFFCSNVCAAYDRHVYFAMGGFPKKAIFNEDMIYCGRLIKSGFRIAYVAEGEVLHSHNYSGKQQFQRNFDLAVSHAAYPEVFKGVKTVGEGIKLVRKTIGYLLSEKKGLYIVPLFYRSACKYLGYALGKNYKRLPRWLVISCSMNKEFWK
ncbi:MAG TPA: glycosyltransferase family 2 protein [Lachnospiraceae bacterium]